MNEVDKMLLLELAREAIKTKFENKEPNLKVVKHLNKKHPVFISLKKHKNLRGGMGVFDDKKLYESVIEAARKAAFEDPRFNPLQADELRFLKIELSILEKPETFLVKNPEDYPEQITIGEDGLIMEGSGKALLLPYVATEKGYTSTQFLNALSQAAGLSFNGWKDPVNRVLKFKAETFRE